MIIRFEFFSPSWGFSLDDVIRNGTKNGTAEFQRYRVVVVADDPKTGSVTARYRWTPFVDKGRGGRAGRAL